MSEGQKSEGQKSGAAKPHKPPKGRKTHHTLELGGETLSYTALAQWQLLHKHDKPTAEIFHVAYLKDEADSTSRPITFIFNGGPGASSAYLHVGALGPRRVLFNEDGSTTAPPATLIDNSESWLAFTDLVFVDPVGTGFSRAIEAEAKPGDSAAEPAKPGKAFFGVKSDLEALGEFIRNFLSEHHRWDSPVFIAGESYGGFRTGKLTRLLQENYGVGLNGAILISPALEWALLDPSDYDVLHWVDVFPTMALAARWHGKSRIDVEDDARFKQLAETFALTELAACLVQGEYQDAGAREATLHKMADFLGLGQATIQRCAGRLPFENFVRLLLRDSHELVGLYDATARTTDPFPDRDSLEGPDPTLSGIARVFAGGINSHLRHRLEVKTSKDYALLNEEAFLAWRVDNETHAFDRQVGAVDDMRYAMSLNPHMKLFITHGLYDLVTPYFSADRIVAHMRLTEAQRANLTVQHFHGGHMFYAWEKSRIAFTAAMREFYSAATD